jgi:hypothetical protein
LKLSSSVDEETIADVSVRIDRQGKISKSGRFHHDIDIGLLSSRSKSQTISAPSTSCWARTSAPGSMPQARTRRPHAFLVLPMTQAIIRGGIEIVGRSARASYRGLVGREQVG